jgi:hypothetical protein
MEAPSIQHLLSPSNKMIKQKRDGGEKRRLVISYPLVNFLLSYVREARGGKGGDEQRERDGMKEGLNRGEYAILAKIFS